MTVPVAPSAVTTAFDIRRPGRTTAVATATITTTRWDAIDEAVVTCPAVTLPAGRWQTSVTVSSIPAEACGPPITNQNDTTIGSTSSVAVPTTVYDTLHQLDGTTATVTVTIDIRSRSSGLVWNHYASGTGTVSVPAAPASTAALRYGSSVNLVLDPDTGALTLGVANAVKMRPYLDALVDAGADMVRTGTGWSFLQQTSGGGVFDPTFQASVDQFYVDCADRDLKVVAIIGGVPAWAGGKPTASTPILANVDQYVDAYVARWQPYAIEFDNEPNIGFGYGAVVTAAHEARVLREVYLRVKAADPSILVGGCNLSFADTTYLQGLYNSGVGTMFDYVSIHPYDIVSTNINDFDQFYLHEPRAPWVHDDTGTYIYGGHGQGAWVQGATAIYRTMRANGDAHKPVWVTEGGWSASLMLSNPKMSCSEAQQADYIALGLRQLARCPFVETVLTYSTYDDPNPQTTWTAWGITRTEPDADHKAAWTAWKNTVAGIKAGTL